VSGVVWVLQQISYAFQQWKDFDNRLRFDKVTESLKVGTSFETQCRYTVLLASSYCTFIRFDTIPACDGRTDGHRQTGMPTSIIYGSGMGG